MSMARSVLLVLAAACLWGACDDEKVGVIHDASSVPDAPVVFKDGPLPDKGICGPPNTQCGTSCFNLQNDAKNCGACANACNAGEVCANGKCALSCPTGQDKCGGGDAGAP